MLRRYILNRMLLRAVVLMMFLELTIAAQTLKVQPAHIGAGAAATLSWDTNGTPAFIIGYGSVPPKGEVSLSPPENIEFVMIWEQGENFQYRSARLVVEGQKGDDGYPSLKSFDVALQGTREGASYITFQGIVWSELQSKGYGVKGDYVPKRPFVTFYTNFVLRPDLISKNERVRARRLAFAVEIYEPVRGAPIAFGVRARLEFQYRGEDEWRPDMENPLSRAEALALLQRFQKAK
jgi:hypothetical protein